MAILYDEGFGVKKDAVRSGQWCLKMKEFDKDSKLPGMVCNKD